MINGAAPNPASRHCTVGLRAIAPAYRQAKRSPHEVGLNPFLGGDGGDRNQYAYLNAALQQKICVIW
ncbi:hypothetical protein [Quatrionicoccus australiensis]|uniref:hypothetical protein n=1 Tax=Quatrionicoccus australiensis TaxID=138118 RepID=UPI001CFA2E59|nr:hypothetical protein [Quatrionicoccus australiensis]MCB4358616.1 hypothetical protein [Quatrionicoccus australiensis]